MPFDDAAAEEAGRLRHFLETRGQIIGPHDLLIAAIGLVLRWTVVTTNRSEFQRIAGLALDDWTAG